MRQTNQIASVYRGEIHYMDCWQCGSKAIQGKALCEKCMAIPREKPKPSEIRYNNIERKFSLRILWLAPLAIFLIYSLLKPSTPIPLKGIKLKTLNGTDAELCENKQACIAIFLAPWCGSCQSEVGFINELTTVTRNSNLGLEVIVGWAGSEELKQFGSRLNGHVFLDSKNDFRSRLSFSSVPRWFSINAKQEVTRSFLPYTYMGNNPREQLKDIIENYAKELGPYF